MANLFDSILAALPADTGSVLGAQLGESPDATLKGLSGVVPLLLSAFAGKAASGGNISSLVSLVQSGLSGGNPLDNPAGLLAAASSTTGSSGLASQLLGSGLAPVAAAIASYFGLKGSSVNSLLSLAGPLVVGGIGKALGSSPSAEGIRNLLVSEKDSYAAALPPELRKLVSTPVPHAAAAPVVEETTKPGTWKWLLLGLALLGLLGWLFFGRGHKETPPPAPAETAAVETAPVVAPRPCRRACRRRRRHGRTRRPSGSDRLLRHRQKRCDERSGRGIGGREGLCRLPSGRQGLGFGLQRSHRQCGRQCGAFQEPR